MIERKQAFLLFCKPPIPGLVKTRLTIERGGIFTQEQAAELFRRCIYDMTELAMQALDELEALNAEEIANNPDADRITYDYFISTTPAENLPIMKETFDAIGPWPRPITYMVDEGKSFDEHFDTAFHDIFAQGYESVVAVGGDQPTMPRDHIVQAFKWLDYFQATGEIGGFVQAPCQECGTSLVGYSANTPMDSKGVYYNLEGRPALDGYIEKARERNVPLAFLSPVSDIDEGTDLAHATSCLRAIAESAKYQPDLFVAKRVLDWIDWMGITVGTPPNENHDPRQYIDA